MGMDVYGNEPKNQCGRYFGVNMSGWSSFATYLCEVAPAITAKCTHWYSNDFDGLNGEDSILLADLLQNEIDSGRTKKYARRWHSERGMTPNELMRLCGATGNAPERSVSDSRDSGIVGSVFDEDDGHLRWVERVQEFVHFLRHCGGFQIA